MFPLGVALLIVGYGVLYYGIVNARNGGKGPSFTEVFGIASELSVENSTGGNSSANMTGQPPSSNDSPVNGVWT